MAPASLTDLNRSGATGGPGDLPIAPSMTQSSAPTSETGLADLGRNGNTGGTGSMPPNGGAKSRASSASRQRTGVLALVLGVALGVLSS